MKISYDYILIYPCRNLSLSIHAQKLIALNLLLVQFQGNFLILILKIFHLNFPYVAIAIAQTVPSLGFLRFLKILAFLKIFYFDLECFGLFWGPKDCYHRLTKSLFNGCLRLSWYTVLSPSNFL